MAKEFTGAQVERALERVKTEIEKAIELEAPNGTKYRIIVSNDGTLSTEAVVQTNT